MSRSIPRRIALRGLLNGAAVTVALPFLESVLRNDAAATAFLAVELSAENPDLTRQHAP